MALVVPSTDILRWPVTSGHRQDDCICGLFAISDHTKLILRLCNINGWWTWHRSHTLARFGHNFVCHVTYLPISPQGRPRFELPYRVNLQQSFEFKIVLYRKIITYQNPQSNLPNDWDRYTMPAISKRQFHVHFLHAMFIVWLECQWGLFTRAD